MEIQKNTEKDINISFGISIIGLILGFSTFNIVVLNEHTFFNRDYWFFIF